MPERFVGAADRVAPDGLGPASFGMSHARSEYAEVPLTSTHLKMAASAVALNARSTPAAEALIVPARVNGDVRMSVAR